jgi:hypothetical protein
MNARHNMQMSRSIALLETFYDIANIKKKVQGKQFPTVFHIEM